MRKIIIAFSIQGDSRSFSTEEKVKIDTSDGFISLFKHSLNQVLYCPPNVQLHANTNTSRIYGPDGSWSRP